MNYYDKIQFLLETKYKGIQFNKMGGDPDRYDDGTDPYFRNYSSAYYKDSLNPDLKFGRAIGLAGPGYTRTKRVDPGEKYNRELARNTLAHEAWHARFLKKRKDHSLLGKLKDKLGGSEILASAYGGWRGPVPGSPISKRIKGAFRDVRDYGLAGDIYNAGLEKPINRVKNIHYRIKQSFGPNSSLRYRIKNRMRNLIAGKPFGF